MTGVRKRLTNGPGVVGESTGARLAETLVLDRVKELLKRIFYQSVIKKDKGTIAKRQKTDRCATVGG